MKRFRASLSSFFAWAVRERLIAANPVTGTRVPVGRGAQAAIRPFAEDELESFYLAVSAHDQQLADIVADRRVDRTALVGAAGGSGARLRPCSDAGAPGQPGRTRGYRGQDHQVGQSRRMPVADRVLSLVEACAHGKGPDDLLFTTKTGHRLHASALKRTLHWSTVAPGRRIHDLRHTAACLWLAKGVDPVTVQAWMGHASIATTNIYLHHLGSSADRAGLDRLNAPGARGVRTRRIERNDNVKPRIGCGVCAGGAGLPGGGAEGIRTPDLLIANETRYQLRHSPTAPAEPARGEKIPPGPICYESPSGWDSGADGPLTTFGRPALARAAFGGPASGARATISASSAVRPEVQVPGSPRSMVRTVRLARGLVTYVGRVTGSGSQRVPVAAAGTAGAASAACRSATAMPMVSSVWSTSVTPCSSTGWTAVDTGDRLDPIGDRGGCGLVGARALGEPRDVMCALPAHLRAAEHQVDQGQAAGNGHRPRTQVPEVARRGGQHVAEQQEHQDPAAASSRGSLAAVRRPSVRSTTGRAGATDPREAATGPVGRSSERGGSTTRRASRRLTGSRWARTRVAVGEPVDRIGCARPRRGA